MEVWLKVVVVGRMRVLVSVRDNGWNGMLFWECVWCEVVEEWGIIGMLVMFLIG